MAGMPVLRLVVIAACLGAVVGCVEPYGGSNVQITFSIATPTAAAPGATPEENQPPANTHLVLFAADYQYQVDDNGDEVLDGDGEPIVEEAYVFRIKEFEIVPLIDTSSPCFIDLEDARFPGVHVTSFLDRLQQETGITDPFAADQDEGDVIDVLTAERRMELLPNLSTDLKTVTAHSSYSYPPMASGCGGDPSMIPPPQCFDDASNALRLELCQAAWAEAGTDFYEGSDKVFSLPLNGQFYGMVEGANPVNDAPVGGSGFFVDTNLVGMDSLWINWDYDDPADDPNGVDRSPTGYHFMRGSPEQYARGVINATLVNYNDSGIGADVAIFPDLANDDVHF